MAAIRQGSHTIDLWLLWWLLPPDSCSCRWCLPFATSAVARLAWRSYGKFPRLHYPTHTHQQHTHVSLVVVSRFAGRCHRQRCCDAFDWISAWVGAQASCLGCALCHLGRCHCSAVLHWRSNFNTRCPLHRWHCRWPVHNCCMCSKR